MNKEPRPKVPLSVVGVGASSDGLVPLQHLIAAIPVDTGSAVVVL